jgi:hypothetical protein
MLSRCTCSVASLLLAGTAVFAADPVGTWQIAGRVRVTACARGQCQSDSRHGEGTLTIAADRTYTVRSGLSGCDAPDEHGTWVAKTRGRYLLKPSNVRQLVRALARCLGASGVSHHGRFRNFFTPKSDGTTATGHRTFSGGGSYRGIGFNATATERYTGTRLAVTARADISRVSPLGVRGIVGGVTNAIR